MPYQDINQENGPATADITETKDGEDLHHRLAMNVIGTFLDGTNDLKKFIEEESYKEVKNGYTELGKSIVELQDKAAEGINDRGLDDKIKEQIEQLCTNIKAANDRNKSNEAASNAALTMTSGTVGPNHNEIFKQFQEAKKNKGSTLYISTENRAQVIAEYKDHIAKNEIKESPLDAGEKKSNAVGFEIDTVNKQVKGIARSENDGRLMARKVAEMNGYNPNKKYHISLGKFKKDKEEGKSETWYPLSAAVGYMREHRKYGATASFSLGTGKTMTLESWAKNQEENAVNLQLKFSHMDYSNPFGSMTDMWKRSGSRVNDSIDIAGELLINEARELALKKNPRLDTSNLAALNVATYGQLSKAMENLGKKLGNEKGNMFSQDTIVGKVEKAMTEDDSFLNRSSVKQVIEAAEKSMRLNMGVVEISQLSQGFANAQSPNPSNTESFDIVFNNGEPVEGQNTTSGKEPLTIQFSKNADGQRVFSEAEIKEERKYTEKSFLGTRLSVPSTWQTGVDDVITSPYWATCALINHTWQSCKVLTKGAFAGLYTTGMATLYMGQKMTGSMAEGETFVDKTLGSYGGGYKSMTEFYNSVSSIGFKSVSQWIRSLPGSFKQFVKSNTGLKELSITKGFMSIASGIASNPLSVIYNSLPAVSGRSIKHKMNEIFYADPNTSISSPGEGLKQNITAREIIDSIKDKSFNLENMNVRHLVRRGIPDDAIKNLNKNREVCREVCNVLSKYDDDEIKDIMRNINDDKDTYKTNLRQAVIASMGSKAIAMDTLKSSYLEKNSPTESRLQFATNSVADCDQDQHGSKATEEQVKNNIKISLLENFQVNMTNVENDTGAILKVKNDENGKPYLAKEVTDIRTGIILTARLEDQDENIAALNNLVDNIMENVSVTDDEGNIDMDKAATTLAKALETTEDNVLSEREVKERIDNISNDLKGKTSTGEAKETIKNMSSNKPITKDSLVEMASKEIKDEKTSESAIKNATENVRGAFGVDDNNRPNNLVVLQSNNNIPTPSPGAGSQ